MKIALIQQNYHIGNFEYNVQKIIDGIRQAAQSGAELAVFSELCVTGYPPQDFLEFDDFIEQTNEAILKIAKETEKIGVLIGAPTKNENLLGKNLFNSALYLYQGKVQQVVNKTLLPNYDVFDEYRYFEPNKDFTCIEHAGKKIAVVICEDSWDIDEDVLYTINPMDELKKQDPQMIINISASPFSYAHAGSRKKMMEWNTKRYGLPMIYVNNVGGHTELIFDGGSLMYNAQGELVKELKYFEEDFAVVDTEEMKVSAAEKRSDICNIHDALVLAIRDYFHKLGFGKATLGLSGGIDSAVTAVLAARALGAENVHGILMPSQYSSGHSVDDAKVLAENLQIKHDIIAIKDIYDAFEEKLSPFFTGMQPDVTEENIQARTRGVLLMAMANKFKYVLLNTSNKSEVAVGYGTLYGDMCGGISVLGDVYKTQVYELAKYINKDAEVIPLNSITKPPSAELRPGQKDSDSLPEYDVLDKLLYQYIECRQGPKELVKLGFDEALVKRVLRLVNINEHKRAQTPPILRISDKAFGMGRRMPIVGKYLSGIFIILSLLLVPRIH
jgi:NAD+ synthase (glutamine-hydrolysing)